MSIKRIQINALEDGMVAAEDVYTFTDQLIIQKGTVLTDRIIARLKFYSISSVRIDTSAKQLDTDSISIPQTTLSNSYRAQVMSSPEFSQFRLAYSGSTSRLTDMLDDIASSQSRIDTDALLGQVSDVMSQVRNTSNLFDILHCMRDSDDMTYTHSMNVALISTALARWIGLPEEDLPVLTVAALLHDVGKLLIPKEILEKPGSLTSQEYAVVQTHSLLGYNLLKSQEGLDERIMRTALMHHERCDGSGYPMGMNGSQIDDFAKIVAIADVYDAMSSRRSYRDEICPFSIIRLFEAEGLQKYDPGYILTFLQGIAETYLHNNVLLSDGTQGEIIMINKNDLSRPVVKLTNDTYVDLSHKRDLSIQAIL